MRPRITFVTDPLCSWCWGMLPEMFKVRERLTPEMDFDLLMAGLQVGAKRPLATRETRYLRKIWQEVEATTGQTFSGRLPEDDDFIYHSEVPCRAVEAMRVHAGSPPWEFFHRLQEAFYVEARNLNDMAELLDLAEPWGVDRRWLADALGAETIIHATRQSFERASKLAAHALPTVLFELGDGPQLVCGGYATADYLVDELRLRLRRASPSH